MAAVVAGALVLSVAPASVAAAEGRACRPDANELLVTFQPVDHTVGDHRYFRGEITVHNRDRGCELGRDWALYFSSVRQPLAVYPPELGDPARAELAAQGLTLTRADKAQSGDYFVLKPTASFQPIRPGQQRKIGLNLEFWAIHKSDAPAGWHISYGGATPRWVPGKTLLDPDDPKQTTAFDGDVRPVETAASRFKENTAQRADLALADRILPRPLSATAGQGTLTLEARGLTVESAPDLRNEASYLESALDDVLGGDRGDAASAGAGSPEAAGGSRTRIKLATSAGLDVDGDGKADPEGYRLAVGDKGVEITGADRAGVLYGIQTLRQLIPVEAYAAAARGREPDRIKIPRATIADAPLFGYRGMAIDVGRHFETPRTVKKFLDLMSYLKLNRLHLHLTDDEGWRVEIPGLPELTTFGARRGHDLAEKSMLHQAMGSGNDLRPGDGIAGKPRDERQANLGRIPAYQGYEDAMVNLVGKGSGHYSRREFVDLLAYARQRHIQVVPEFDFPAHARAAVQAMERRYQRLKDSDPAEANRYRLLDPEDTTRHVSVQYYTDNIVNPCISSTYAFLTKVVTEVKRMYDQAGAPLTTVNLGGDEAPHPTWTESPACDRNPETAGKTDQQLMDLFFAEWNKIAQTVAPTTAGWEDVLKSEGREITLPNFIALPWQNVWGWGREDWAYRFANKGTKVVLAHATNLYMDLAYNKDPDEPGYYWAAYVDEESTFTYQPFNVYANATENRWGGPVTPSPAWERLTEEGKKNILGMEAQLWAENGKAPEIREYQAFPKLLGVAERAWNRRTPTPEQMPAAWKVFVNTLGQVTFPLLSFYQPVGLDGVGVNYRIPLPGGEIRSGTLTANVRNPGLTIEYSTDGRTWRTYTAPVQVGDRAFLRTKAPDGRTSRVAPVKSG
ncbi:family 20 glycosylhydrolase [Bailinhaonella thermotolerans]|uniref:beta-N-acetylhexosaminidase n=1 Tax=Bailinhaonella thermotolerans TaxID=1070861 RepID=A0A3A4ARS8_9ACTN|nr:family 20 glycosylhydrolase [Bailinhaonella thermotolerans]RJL31861.1 beta-hexosaminidase [Bailinhaonella thermotolerans]